MGPRRTAQGRKDAAGHRPSGLSRGPCYNGGNFIIDAEQPSESPMSYRSILFFAAMSAAVLHAGTYYPARPGEAVVPNEYLVKFAPGASPSQVLPGIVPGSVTQPLPAANIQKITLPAGSSAADAIRLAASPL